MSRGKGGAIKNWKKSSKGNNFWYYTGNKDAKMTIGRKTNKGYPIKLFGDDVRTKTVYKPTKTKATSYAAKWRRKNTKL